PAALDPSPGTDRPALARTGPRRPRSPQRLQLPDRWLGVVGLVPARTPRGLMDHLAGPRCRRPDRPRAGPGAVAPASPHFARVRGAGGARGGRVVAGVADLGLGAGRDAAGLRIGPALPDPGTDPRPCPAPDRATAPRPRRSPCVDRPKARRAPDQ